MAKKIRRVIRNLKADAKKAKRLKKRTVTEQERKVAAEKRGMVPRHPDWRAVDHGEPEQPWQIASDHADNIVALIDDEVSLWAKQKAPDFFEDIRRKCVEVGNTISRLRRVTSGQQSALNGWENGVRKWIK